METISGYENINDHMVEHLIRSFGADNFAELSKIPDQMREEIERITSIIDGERRESIIERAAAVSEEMKDVIETHLKERRPIDKTRNELGISSENRKHFEKSYSPIDEVWDLISPSIPNVTKNQFFGFEPILGIEGVQHTQHGAITRAHIVLNMLGISPDKGLAKREKIKNIMSDGQHIGMASYCNAIVSADKAFSNKARCIYTYLSEILRMRCILSIKGLCLTLGIERNKT